MSSEPKTPFRSTHSNKTTPKSSNTLLNSNTSTKSSSKWAKFQEKFHSYSNKSNSTTNIHQSNNNNNNNSNNITPTQHQYPHFNPPYLSNKAYSSTSSSFDLPNDYFNKAHSSSLDENSLSPLLNLGTSKSSHHTLNSTTTPPSHIPSRTTSIPKTSESLLPTPLTSTTSSFHSSFHSSSVTSTPNNHMKPQDSTTNNNIPSSPTKSGSATLIPSTPPKVTPFMYSKSSNSNSNTPARSKKTLINEKCCFCEELLSTKFSSGEKIIELSCGDTCHEECLWLLINDTTNGNDSKTSDPHKIFPNCGVCDKFAIPLDDTITDSMISKHLLSTPPKINFEESSSKTMSNSSSSDSLIISSNFQTQTLSPNSRYSRNNSFIPPSSSSTASTASKNHKYESLSLSNRNQKDLSIQIPANAKNYKSHGFNRHKSSSRGSSISAMSSIISSVSRSPSPTHTSNNIDSYMSLNNTGNRLNKIPLAMLRAEYISHLVQMLQINYSKSFKESKIDSFGLLRLVDKLLISQNGEEFKTFIVYLFQYNLILVEEDFTKIESFKLLKIPKVQTPTSSILKVSLNNGQDSLYLSQKSNKILQKWIAGLCDYEFIFNSDNLSSTLKPPSTTSSFNPIDPQSLQSNHDPNDTSNSSISSSASSTMDVDDLVAPHTIQTNDDKIDQMTIPVLLSPIQFEDTETPIVDSPTETFFEKTENLIFIIDHERSLTSSIKIILQNIIKALSIKFQSLKIICSTEKFQAVYSFGDCNDSVITQIGNISNQDSKGSVNGIIQTLLGDDKSKYGLLVISNNLTKESIKTLSIPNQLIVQIQNHNSVKLTSRENLVKLDSWENIMEILISRYQISFDDDSDFDDVDSDIDSDINSDFDSDFDSDAQSISQSDNEEEQQSQEVSKKLSDDENEEESKEELELKGNDDDDENNNEIKIPECNNEHKLQDRQISDNEELPSLNSNDANISTVQNSPISDEDSTTFDSKIIKTSNTSSSRWSSLFKDIDDALLETTANLSIGDDDDGEDDDDHQ